MEAKRPSTAFTCVAKRVSRPLDESVEVKGQSSMGVLNVD